jgi:hypothetical protein
MERRIPDPLTVEDLQRDPELIFAVHARGRRMRAQMRGTLWRAAAGAVSQASERVSRRLQSTRFATGTLAASAPDPTATR